MSTVKPIYRPYVVFSILCVINLFNYIDRGIIPGSPQEFNQFIRRTVNTTTPDVYLGLLQSSFVVGFVIGAIIFGHMVHRWPEFSLMGVGLSIWLVAVTLSGISYSTGSYVFLIIARMLSGFGEASIQCVAPVWIEHAAPAGWRGTWLSIFYTAIPVGTAVGYTYSSAISTSIGWEFAFYIEAIIMAPFIASLFVISHKYPKNWFDSLQNSNATHSSVLNVVGRSSEDQSEGSVVPDDRIVNDEGGSKKSYQTLEKDEDRVSVWQEVWIVCKEPIFICLALGNAAQTASLAGAATFGSAFLLGLDYYNTESQSSFIFGVAISVAGIVGTPLGGWLLDLHKGEAKTKRSGGDDALAASALDRVGLNSSGRSKEVEFPQHSPENNLNVSYVMKVIFWNTLVGTALLCIVYWVYNKGAWVFLVTLGCLLIFATNPGIYLGVMLCVHPKNRSFAIALNSVLEHAFGDVPSPIIIGYIKDRLAPSCVTSATVDDDASASTSAACRAEGHGLRLTILVTFAYMFLTAIFFLVGWFINDKRVREDQRRKLLADATAELEIPTLC